MLEPAGQARPPHTIVCVWFWAWAAIGALAVGSLSLGVLTAAPALVLGVLLAKVGDAPRKSIFGLLTGAGLPLLWVAYAQRQGPGTICWHTATSAGCDQYLNPLPWLMIGIALVLTGLAAHTPQPIGDHAPGLRPLPRGLGRRCLGRRPEVRNPRPWRVR